MPEPDDGVQHRPLPSVGIPILRDDVRASRVRRGVAGGTLGALLLAGIVAALLWPGGDDASDAPDPVAEGIDTIPEEDELPLDEAGVAMLGDPLPEPAPTAEEALVVVEETTADEGNRVVRRFGTAPGFRPALTNGGMTGAEADALIAALDDVMDFRRCRPEHEMVITRDASGLLTSFEYRASTTSIYRAERDDEGALQGRQVEVPIERVRVRRGGTVRNSLGAALEAAGLGRTLVGTFVEVFERQVNFNTDTRAGDTFRIIVDEERIAGELLRYGTVHAIEVRGARLGEQRAFYFAPRENLTDFYDPSGRAVHGGWLRTPLRYDHISSPFDPHRRHPILNRIQPHNGIDYAAGTGTPVWAAADGVITWIGDRGPNGNLISLRHDNNYESHYAHLHRFARGLSRGDRVEQRQVIGYVGTTGRSTGPHLHFGLKRNGRFLDPAEELNGPGRMLPGGLGARFQRHRRELEAELARIPVTGSPTHTEDEAEPEAEDSDGAETEG
ncbi:MAG: peptidoglycan DD-metalloendopeptidase family protein [Sandaracinaceae bacterium]